jgi:prepilin-type processing-associated H-X9-DG protein
MKKSLWIAMAALAVGYGMSAHAVTNSVFGAWSFEGIAAGTKIPSTAGSALADPYGTWSADTNNGVAYITNVTVTGPSFPLGSETHTNVLYFDGSVTNHFETNSLLQNRFVTDFLLKPGQLEDLSLLNQVDASARLAFYFDTNGYFNLMHGDATVWTTSTFATVYASNDWVRVTIDQDYDARPDLTNPGFTIALNGTNLTHANAYTRTGPGAEDFTGPGPGGTWFPVKNGATKGMNALVGMGIGMLDDVVNSAYSMGVLTLNVLATSINPAYGTIEPSGTVVISNGTPRLFTFTVNGGVPAHVLGFTINGVQVYTNAPLNQSLTQQTYTVAYADVASNNTPVQAMFGPNSIQVLAASFNSAYGVITPTAPTITYGTPQTFTLTVAADLAGYVSGLRADPSATILTNNTTQSVRTQSWDVTYEQVSAFGTNLTALFAVKSSTTAKWITDSFTVGPGMDYETFAAAEAGDWDSDGFNNKAEAIVGTDPKDGTSFLKIASITVNALGNIVVTFQGSAAGANVPYNLYASDGVNDTYASIATEGKGAGTLSIIVTPSTAKKFYKVVVPYTGE